MSEGEREVYTGRVVTLRLKYLRQPDGSTRLREVVEHAPGAAVVAVHDNGDVVLVRLEPLVTFYSSPGFSTELLHVFVASGLRASTVAGDEEEEIEVVRMPLEAAIQRVLRGEVSDAKTVAGLLAYARAPERPARPSTSSG